MPRTRIIRRNEEPTPIVVARDEEQTMLSKFNDNEIARTVAPLVGAAGGTLVITAAVERFGVRSERIALGGAALAVTLARNADGAIKDALTGAAAAGLCLGILELLEKHRPTFLYGDKPKQEPAPTNLTDAISRADLAKALAELHDKLAAQAREREEVHLKETQELHAIVRDLLARLTAANAEIERLHAAARRRSRDASTRPHLRQPDLPVEIAEKPAVARKQTIVESDATSATAAPEQEQPLAAPADVAPAADGIAAEDVTQMQAVYALLDADERKNLSMLMAGMPAEDAAQIRAGFAQLDPTEAVAFLRRTFFASKAS
jgi:hypothetical protein